MLELAYRQARGSLYLACGDVPRSVIASTIRNELIFGLRLVPFCIAQKLVNPNIQPAPQVYFRDVTLSVRLFSQLLDELLGNNQGPNFVPFCYRPLFGDPDFRPLGARGHAAIGKALYGE